MNAVKSCPNLQAFANRILATGKPKKVAIIAVARKLLMRLNAMLRDQVAYTAR